MESKNVYAFYGGAQCWLHIIFCLAPDFVGAELALCDTVDVLHSGCVAQWMCGTMDDRTTSYLKVVMVATWDLPMHMGSKLSLKKSEVSDI